VGQTNKSFPNQKMRESLERLLKSSSPHHFLRAILGSIWHRIVLLFNLFVIHRGHITTREKIEKKTLWPFQEGNDAPSRQKFMSERHSSSSSLQAEQRKESPSIKYDLRSLRGARKWNVAENERLIVGFANWQNLYLYLRKQWRMWERR